MQKSTTTRMIALRKLTLMSMSAIAGASLLFGGITAFANLSANPIIVEFQDGQQVRKDITVTNSSSRPQYLRIDAVNITNPGQGQEVYASDSDPNKVGLLVAPAAFGFATQRAENYSHRSA